MNVRRPPLWERLRGNGSGQGALLPGGGRRRLSLIESFNHAVEGIIHVLRTHRNMRLHFLAAVVVLVLALVLGVSRIELIVLLLSIAFVLIAEMINSAIEAAIDVATSSFDPLAKLAKDIAAGAVLIASINAVAVGYLVFSGQVQESGDNIVDRLRDAPAKLTIISLAIVVILVIATKALTGRGTPLRGGLPSGHAAVAFAAWMAVTQMLDPTEHRFLISMIMLGVASLVAYSRIETGIHSAARGRVRRTARRRRDAARLPGVRVIDDTDRELYERTLEISKRAYAPYSSFHVGAVLRARDGTLFDGVNVENAAYPLGVCGEKTAYVTAVTSGLQAWRLRPDRDQCLALRRLPPVAHRVQGRPRRLREQRRRARRLHAGRAAAGHVRPLSEGSPERK